MDMREAFEVANSIWTSKYAERDEQGIYIDENVHRKWVQWSLAWRSALQYQPQWVSCAERLPTEADQVRGILACQRHDRDVIAAHGLYVDCWVYDGGTLTLGDVSHWMPFPQPPEE